MVRVLIASGNSKTGKAVIKHLKQLGGVTIVAGVRDVAKSDAELKALGADELVPFDFSKPDVIEKSFEGIERVYFAQAPNVSEDLLVWTENVVKAATKPGSTVRLLVRMSSVNSDPNTKEALIQYHGKSDLLVKASGVPWVLIQSNFFAENWERQADALKGGQVMGASGDGRIAYVAVKDVAEVTAIVLHDPTKYVGRELTLSGPAALHDNEAMEVINRAAGINAKFLNLTPEEFAARLRSFGFPEGLVTILADLEGLKSRNWASQVTQTIKEITGREATSFQEWAAQNAARFQ